MFVSLGSPHPRGSPDLLHPTPHCQSDLPSVYLGSVAAFPPSLQWLPFVYRLKDKPLGEAWRLQAPPCHLLSLSLSLSLSRSCTLVKCKHSGPPKCILSTLVSASSCSLSIFVKILLPKILSSPRWASRVLQPCGRTPTALRLSLEWGPSSCCNAVCLLSPAALPPAGLWAPGAQAWVSTVPTRPGRAQVQGGSLLPYPFPQQPSISAAGG